MRLGPWAEPGVDRTWKGTAILPQVIAPIMELTMTENVALPLRLVGLALATSPTGAPGKFSINSTSPTKPIALHPTRHWASSSAWASARAAVVDPIVLLADEPTSHQDAGHIATVLRLARSMVDRGTCIVVATHDPAVSEVADRVLDLDR